MQELADVFSALSEVNRLRMLSLFLTRDTLCVGDFVNLLDIPQPNASRHLAILKRVGLLEVKHKGTYAYYSLAAKSDSTRDAILDLLGSLLAKAKGSD